MTTHRGLVCGHFLWAPLPSLHFLIYLMTFCAFLKYPLILLTMSGGWADCVKKSKKLPSGPICTTESRVTHLAGALAGSHEPSCTAPHTWHAWLPLVLTR